MFGTRRRFFLAKYKKPSLSVCNRNPGFVGTSNYDLARRLSLTPMGNTGTRMVPGTSANQPGSSQQPASCTCCPAGRVSRPTWHCINRLHHYGCFPA
ncbi:hypothetical protein ACP0HM_01350 [Escherichia coli]